MLSNVDMRGPRDFKIKVEIKELGGGFSVDFEVFKMKNGEEVRA